METSCTLALRERGLSSFSAEHRSRGGWTVMETSPGMLVHGGNDQCHLPGGSGHNHCNSLEHG